MESYRDRARRWTVPARNRRARGIKHPVEDFLFTYYFLSLKKLEEWHPSIDETLEDSGEVPEWLRTAPYVSKGGVLRMEPRLSKTEKMRLEWILELLVATRDRDPHFGCHGLHEWAMIYTGENVRHRESCPLRLSQIEIDEVVRSRPLTCTHFDAFRFFHPSAGAMNRCQPSLDRRIELEQPGCIHANMDLYKWASKSLPWVGSELVLDCFELAAELREVDMRASPYDLSEFGLEAIPIESPDGRKAYEAEQRRLSVAAAPLRQRLIDSISSVLEVSADVRTDSEAVEPAGI
ncbi:3-methyladenine DNA glycosylase [Haloferula helveola]|uniref:3-methyladenine DNA glycosylase n=1 Tax=Haloferula helveola TaxID=490095 RepID=A0ABN6HCI6_9BACT|nr:3-methyladenine DNA glycosylase [Haloferula helveola]